MLEQYGEYLKGNLFNNGLKVKLFKNNLIFKNEFIKTISRGGKIIHFGFTDHLELIDEKIKKGLWLHKQLVDIAEKCIGIDINEKAVRYLKEKYKLEDIYVLNIVKDDIPIKIANEKFDYLLLPDVIEHIDNPVYFLKLLKNKFKNVNKFIITIPNAFRWNNFKNNFKNIECINTDHRFWFTPYTIAKILTVSGFNIERIYFAEQALRLSKKAILRNIIIIKFPMFRDTIIVEAT